MDGVYKKLLKNIIMSKRSLAHIEIIESLSPIEGADIQREGIVVRCIENGRKILSFKVINPDFLLKYD